MTGSVMRIVKEIAQRERQAQDLGHGERGRVSN